MKWWTMLVTMLALGGAPVLVAQEPRTVRITFVDAPLGESIRSLALMLGLNVVLTEVPEKLITFRAPEPVPFSEVGGVLEVILESQGLVLVQSGTVAQVMPEAKRPAAGPLRVGKELPSPPPLGLITQIVPLENIQATEVATLLAQTASSAARVEVVPRSNSVLLTDRGKNVARYLELIRQLDVKTGSESGLRTYVHSLKHASADELAGVLSQLFGLTAPQRVGRSRVRALEGRSLSSELEGFRRRELESLEQRRRVQLPVVTVAPSTPGTDTIAGPSLTGALVGETTIIPDAATNSLVIRTAPPNFPVLQETIDQLDVRPAQVLLEVTIAEVVLDRSSKYGINWQVVTDQAKASQTGRGITAGYGPQVFTDSAIATLGGLGVRLISTGRLDARAILQAVASRTSVRVLSTPHVLALNNEEARILVGSEVPFNQSTRSGFTEIVDQVVQFRKVGTQLTIIPTVNNDGYVTFRILQEVSALTSQTIQSALNAPVISTREAETSAIVRAGSTVIIGGLIGEDQQVIRTGIPLMMRIPLLGRLFENRQTTRTRTELAIFVTPHVVFNDAQADSLLRRERDRLPGAGPMLDSLFKVPGNPPAPVRRPPDTTSAPQPLRPRDP